MSVSVSRHSNRAEKFKDAGAYVTVLSGMAGLVGAYVFAWGEYPGVTQLGTGIVLGVGYAGALVSSVSRLTKKK